MRTACETVKAPFPARHVNDLASGLCLPQKLDLGPSDNKTLFSSRKQSRSIDSILRTLVGNRFFHLTLRRNDWNEVGRTVNRYHP